MTLLLTLFGSLDTEIVLLCWGCFLTSTFTLLAIMGCPMFMGSPSPQPTGCLTTVAGHCRFFIYKKCFFFDVFCWNVLSLSGLQEWRHPDPLGQVERDPRSPPGCRMPHRCKELPGQSDSLESTVYSLCGLPVVPQEPENAIFWVQVFIWKDMHQFYEQAFKHCTKYECDNAFIPVWSSLHSEDFFKSCYSVD